MFTSSNPIENIQTSDTENIQISDSNRGDTRNAFLLACILVYKHETIVRLEIEELKKLRQIIKEKALQFQEQIKEKVPNFNIDIETAFTIKEKDEENSWFCKVLKIFDDYIEMREQKKNEKSFCQKATEILSWICNKIISFFSFCFSYVPTDTFSTNEAVALDTQSNQHSESSHRFFSAPTPLLISSYSSRIKIF